MENVYKHIPVLRNDNSIYWLNIDEICYSSMEGRRITYHTKNEAFYQLQNFEDVLLLLTKERGYERLDRGIVVQMEKITYYNSEIRLLYFDDVIDKKSKFTTVAFDFLPKVKKLLGKIKDISQNNW